MYTIRVFLADDHALVRSGLKLFVESQPDMIVVGESGAAVETIEAVRASKPDIVLLDLSMPGGSPSDTISHLLYQNPNLKILVVTMHDDREIVQKMLSSGAHGYIVKSVADAELLVAIRKVMSDRSYVNLSTTNRDVGILIGEAKRESMIDSLSARELEVFRLLVRGYTNQAVAAEIGVGIKSVESYRARMMTKLNVKSRSEMIDVALKLGMLH